MRDVSHKIDSLRVAVAEARVRVSPCSIKALAEGTVPKGDPFPVAHVAAIQAAKGTPNLLPYCHPVPLDYVGVDFETVGNEIIVRVEAKAIYKTGVEMEALTGAVIAAMNLYDILKPIDDDIEIVSVRLASKTGGKTDFAQPDSFRATVIVASDRASSGEYEDRSGPALKDALEEQGGTVELHVVADIPEQIAGHARASSADFVFVAGGTGLGPRDCAPSVVRDLIDERLEGIEDQWRTYSQRRIPTAMLARIVIGRRGSQIILGIPGSPGAMRDTVAALFPHLKHALHVIRGGGHE
jgi:cyclic pyranopterin phosphate synthase